MGPVHRATFVGTGEFKEKMPDDGQELQYKKSITIECFPDSLLVIHNATNWWFRNVKAEPHNAGKRERIIGRPVFAEGTSEAVIDLYKVPANENELRFKARFAYAGKEWRIDFKGNQTFPL